MARYSKTFKKAQLYYKETSDFHYATFWGITPIMCSTHIRNDLRNR